jgi:hypothetical protein
MLRAGLQHSAVAPDRISKDASLRQSQTERLFTIHILAGLDRRQRYRYVPMVRSCHDDRIDILACDQIAKILVCGAAFMPAGAVSPCIVFINLFLCRLPS